ncbi:hypothetical protein M501DRAFT_998616 [Patellaria atrata CBS 101060]|uniref:HMG box domain-containing protein n=1 Tax=Patellaria atrata CBS 101060 TaxID=1346257 RepID=A0A9P4VW44_9PEZI|nr:hypothetical protein M501DRAFT_998616 [Patellaria atrata CBS 101060]
MLGRGLISRFSADVPKTSTLDVTQLSRCLQRLVRAHKTSSLLRSGYSSQLPFRPIGRHYATAGAKKTGTPTTKVKKDVKKSTHTSTRVRTPAKKTGTKKAATKKAAPKKSKVAKKAAPKKPRKRVLTEKAKERRAVQATRDRIKELKAKALKVPKGASQRGLSAYNVFTQEKLKDKTPLQEASKMWKDLSAADIEHYNHLAREKSTVAQAAYKAWVESHSPDEIRIANNARNLLGRRLDKTKAGRKRHDCNFATIHDERALKTPPNPYARFASSRWDSGDMRHIPVTQASKLIAQEWKALSESEKNVFRDAYKAEKESYDREFVRLYGHKPGVSVAKATA